MIEAKMLPGSDRVNARLDGCDVVEDDAAHRASERIGYQGLDDITLTSCTRASR
jgi:hypothetical protein